MSGPKVDHAGEAERLMHNGHRGTIDDNRELAHLHAILALVEQATELQLSIDAGVLCLDKLVEQLKRVADAMEDGNHAACRHNRGLNCGQCVPEVMKP